MRFLLIYFFIGIMLTWVLDMFVTWASKKRDSIQRVETSILVMTVLLWPLIIPFVLLAGAKGFFKSSKGA